MLRRGELGVRGQKLLRRLLLELIANAARAPGQDRIEVRLRSQGGRAVLTLSGTGAPPTQRQLAAMLQQDTDQRLPMAGSGAGLGLPIARRIFEEHGGWLHLHNAPGHGASFVMVLPVRKGDDVWLRSS